jgi:hypothetical protein
VFGNGKSAAAFSRAPRTWMGVDVTMTAEHPGEIAAITALLLSQDASNLPGATIDASGGHL